jgi:hypothetical protein
MSSPARQRGAIAVVSALIVCSAAAQDDLSSWPKVMIAQGATVTMYQPQLDSWKDNDFESRAAVSVQEGEDPPVFGAVWISGRYDVDRDARLVNLSDIVVPTVAFPEASDDEQQRLAAFLEGAIPTWNLSVPLDLILPMLDNAEIDRPSEEQLQHTPPEIIVAYEPALLIIVDGEPKLQEIEGSPLERVVNTPYVIVKQGATFYLATDDLWYRAKDVMGPWKTARSLPKEVEEIDRQLEAQREEAEPLRTIDEPDATDEREPVIVVSTVPAELIFIDGKPDFTPLQGTDVLLVDNTDSDVVFDIGSQFYYVLLSGRWFRSKDLDRGPWEHVANDEVPAAFVDIPADSDVGYVRSSVAGTDEAREAVLEQSVPQTAAIKHTAGASFSVEYDGTPSFEQIEGTAMQYAVNTGAAVILSGGRYYCCEQGVWYEAASATGPWTVCKKVPDEIYTIPPSNPHYNVTYVKVYDSTPEVVYVGYTPGYTGSYVSHGCVVYGTGWYYRPYWSPHFYYPRPYTWGFHVRWNPWYGWSFGVSYSNGPFRVTIGWGGYGGIRTGGWWGPCRYRPYPRYGYRAGYRAGYRHGYYHGRNAGSARPVHYSNTNININNNIYARPGNSDRVARTRDRGAGARPAAAPNRANNVYTDRNGNVYRRNDNGSWDRRDKGGWSKVDGVPSAGDRARPTSGDRSRPATSDRARPASPSQPSTTARPSTTTRPSTPSYSRPQTTTRPSTGSAPSAGSLNRDYSARQRGSQRSSQYNRSGRSSYSRPSGGAARGGARRR